MSRFSPVPHSRPDTRGCKRAQTLVEFAIILPLLILLIAAIVDFGFFFYDHVATQSACREGARAMVQANSAGAPIYDLTQIRKIVKGSHGPVSPLLDAEITLQEWPGSLEFGSPARRVREIKVDHKHTWIMPIMIPFGETIQIKSKVKGYCVAGLQGI